MAYTIPNRVESWPASTDLSAKKYYICYVNSSGEVAVSGSGASLKAGVLMNTPLEDEAAALMLDGVVPCIAGGTITAGALITSDANGKAAIATGGTVAAGTAGGNVIGQYAIGFARGAAVANEYFTLELFEPRFVAGSVV